MQKKLLITISDDISCLHGVRFVGSFFRNKSKVNTTLFYVAPFEEQAGVETWSGQVKVDKKACEAVQEVGYKAMDKVRLMLCDWGFPPENISYKLIFKQYGTVKDIIREAKAGAYNAVVLGRRGYSLFESVLYTSVTKEILDQDIDFPIWICRRPEERRRNVLLCIDGSPAGLRMVNHVGFMLKDEDEHSITLFHVDQEEGESTEAILGEARKRLIDNWIPDERIECTVAASTGVPKAILEETEARGYAVVGVGRIGVRKGTSKAWLVGSRTMKLVEAMEKAALWVSS